jgi:hypothetical protein
MEAEIGSIFGVVHLPGVDQPACELKVHRNNLPILHASRRASGENGRKFPSRPDVGLPL